MDRRCSRFYDSASVGVTSCVGIVSDGCAVPFVSNFVCSEVSSSASSSASSVCLDLKRPKSSSGFWSKRSPKTNVNIAPLINAHHKRRPPVSRAMTTAINPLLMTPVMMRSSVSGVMYFLRYFLSSVTRNTFPTAVPINAKTKMAIAAKRRKSVAWFLCERCSCWERVSMP